MLWVLTLVYLNTRFFKIVWHRAQLVVAIVLLGVESHVDQLYSILNFYSSKLSSISMLLFVYTNYRSCEMFWRFIWILKFEISKKISACCIISSCKSVSHTEVILLQWCCTLWLATFHSWRPSEALELYLSQSESVLSDTVTIQAWFLLL